jgi:hypothetical protein
MRSSDEIPSQIRNFGPVLHEYAQVLVRWFVALHHKSPGGSVCGASCDSAPKGTAGLALGFLRRNLGA